MATWKPDVMHSQVQFKVKHLVVTTVTGSFGKFDATIEASKDDLTDAKISFEADVDSINTGNAQRDGHLKSDDFFNAEKFPKVKFVSKSLTKVDNENYKVEGDITLRDVTKPITLNAVYGGTIKNFYGKTAAGFEITGKLNRKDFGLKWHAATEAGQIVVSDEVRLDVTMEIVKQD
jgi:polyisoprenoid-binding protein YceI